MLAGSGGSTPDGIQFPGGEILLAWSVSNAQVEYVILNNADLSITSGGLHQLVEPKGRETGTVSITYDGVGHGVLSWGDREQSDYLCYSLIGSQGEVVFPDLTFQIVESFPDLKVKIVESFPNDCGDWQIVDSFPDIKVKIVESFADIKIKFVESFPGIP